MEKKYRLLSALLAVLMLVALVPATAFAGPTTEGYPESYEIYPVPHSVVYNNSGYDLDYINFTVTKGVDAGTQAKMHAALAEAKVPYQAGGPYFPYAQNLSVGILGEDDAVTLGIPDRIGQAFANAAFADVSALEKDDGYVIGMSGNDVFIMGSSARGAYYGVATFVQMLKEGAHLRNVLINDYPDFPNRGTIEGYYGIPWSHETRKSIIEMSGEYKMNKFVYAPKDDPYHFGELWDQPYPEEEAAQMAELAQLANENHVDFVYTLHIGTHMDFSDEDDEINLTLPVVPASTQWEVSNGSIQRGTRIPEGQREMDEYSAEETMEGYKNKFKQLYDLGVRQFGVLMDDISFPLARYNIIYVVPFINELNRWMMEELEGCKPLMFCPSYYYVSDMNYNGRRYMQSVRSGDAWAGYEHDPMDESIEIFFTGNSVMSPMRTSNNTTFINSYGRTPLIWWNYPVTDYCEPYLLMGPPQGLDTSVTNMTGVISNPMQQGVASEVALFAVADYAWNQSAFNSEKNWQDSFKYLWPEVADSLQIFARHSMTGYDDNNGLASLATRESADWKVLRAAYEAALASGEGLEAATAALMADYQSILAALADIRENCPEAELLRDITPWLDKLESIVWAGMSVVDATVATGLPATWEEYSTVLYEQVRWPSITVPNRSGSAVTAEVATSRSRSSSNTNRHGPKDFVVDNTASIRAKVDGLITRDSLTAADSVFTNVAALKALAVTVSGGNTYTLADAAGTTLAKGNYVGIKLNNLYYALGVNVQALPEGLVAQYSANGFEWTEVPTDGVLNRAEVRYARILNTGDAAVTFDLVGFEVVTATITPPSVSSITTTAGIYQTNTVSRLVDGNFTTPYWTNGPQAVGQTVTITYDREFVLNDLALYQGTGDYIRSGEIEISTDNTNWTKVADVNTDYTVERVGSSTFNVIRANLNALSARYIRIVTTGDTSNWTQLYEFAVNEQNDTDSGIVYPFSSVANGVPGNLIDGDVTTPFRTTSNEGYLQYNMSELGNAQSLTVLQNANVISDATVSIRTTDGWQDIGVLDKAYNTFELAEYPNLLGVKFSWVNNGVVPMIHEMYTTTSIDREALAAALALAEAANPSKFTTEDWAALQAAIVLGTGLMNDDLATQAQIDAAVTLIEYALGKEITVSISDLRGLYDLLIKENKELYTTDSWTPFEQALEDAKAVLEAVAPTPQEIQNAYNTLKQTHKDLVRRGFLGFLEALLVQIETGWEEENYTKASWAVVAGLVEQAEVLLSNPANVSQPEVDAVSDALLQALDDLVGAIQLDTLQYLVDTADEMLANEGKYITLSVENLKKVLPGARAVLDVPEEELTQAMVDQAVADLSLAISMMWEKGDLRGLTLLVNTVDRLEAEHFTPSTWAGLAPAMEEARKLLTDDPANVVPEEVTPVYDALAAAIEALEPRANTTGLETAIALAENILSEENRGKYIPSSIAGIPAALESAKLVLTNGDATQVQVDAAQTALMTEVMKARKPANKSSLKNALGLAGGVDKSQFTQQSLEQYEAALAAANKLNRDDNATQEAIEAAADTLRNAALGLEKQEAPVEAPATVQPAAPAEDKQEEQAVVVAPDNTNPPAAVTAPGRQPEEPAMAPEMGEAEEAAPLPQGGTEDAAVPQLQSLPDEVSMSNVWLVLSLLMLPVALGLSLMLIKRKSKDEK